MSDALRDRLQRLCLTAAAVLVALFAIAVVVRAGDPSQVLWIDAGVFNAVYVFAGLALLLRTSQDRLEQWAWRLLGMALLLNVFGGLIYSIYLAPMDSPPYPSVSDAFLLTYYPLCYAALLLMLASRVERFMPSMWLDGLVVLFGMGAVVAGYVLAPFLEVSSASVSQSVTNLSYAVGSLMLLIVGVGGAAVLGARFDLRFGLVVLGLLVNGIADTVYFLQDAAGAYVEGALPDLLWLGAVLLLAFAGSVKGAREDASEGRSHDNEGVVRWGVFVLPAVAVAVSLVVLALAERSSGLARVLAVICVVLGLLRVTLTVNEMRDLGDVFRQARTDDLTGLPNRRALYEACDAMLQDDQDLGVAMLLLDLDRFKEVNDSLGHAAGDELLTQAAVRMRRTIREEDFLARLGGDEFAVLLSDVDLDGAMRVAELLNIAMKEEFVLSAMAVHVYASIGVAVQSPTHPNRTELLRCAGIAMYDAKSSDSGVAAYRYAGEDGAIDRLRMMEGLRAALSAGADDAEQANTLRVDLQPQIDLRTGAVVGVEALVRWLHPTKGWVHPEEFLSAVEDAGLMSRLTAKVLGLSLRECRRWLDRGYDLPVSVNVTTSDIHDPALPATIAASLLRNKVPPGHLTIELTEETLMHDPSRAHTVVRMVRDMGVGMSIDDFGTGYSSLAYLHRLPLDELKIDRSFTTRLQSDPTAMSIVQHTIDLCHALGLRAVAEGVESQSDVQALAAAGCDRGQGYFFAMPMAPDVLHIWLQGRVGDGSMAPSATSARPQGATLGPE